MFNLFRQKHEPTIICALLDGGALPFFLRDSWEYEGKVAEIESQQLKFDQRSHHAVIRRNGFYLFTRMDTAMTSAALPPKPFGSSAQSKDDGRSSDRMTGAVCSPLDSVAHQLSGHGRLAHSA